MQRRAAALATRATTAERQGDGWREVVAGLGGVVLMVTALLTPFLRGRRNHWGLSREAAQLPHPGDDLVAVPRWLWTHAIEIAAPAAAVWPWVAQLGADRAGFYSYQWLENVAGCELHNADRIHPEWEVRVGDRLALHPRLRLPVVACEPGHWFVAHAAADAAACRAGRPWGTASWLLQVEPLGDDRCRVISRYRADSSDDPASSFSFGPAVYEPVGSTMDRRMLRGIKARAERAGGATPADGA